MLSVFFGFDNFLEDDPRSPQNVYNLLLKSLCVPNRKYSLHYALLKYVNWKTGKMTDERWGKTVAAKDWAYSYLFSQVISKLAIDVGDKIIQ